MRACPACGEVHALDAVRCAARGARPRAWHEATTDTQLGPVTDVDRHATLDAPLDLRDGDALAVTPRALTPDALRRVRARGRILGGRYRLAAQLGAGGYGAVFAADDLETGERVAIKVLAPGASQSAELVTRFHREAIAASRARHPHIVDVADFDVDDAAGHYLVMEHLDGRDLAAVLDAGGALPPARALVIAAQCARGLAAAHRVGVLHRDLKPANVFLVRQPDGSEAVKIIDFGISKLTRAAGDYTDVTSASKVVGTPCYMSPEQARGAPLDARADVYALGVMLFEMLVGERPFTGRSPIEILTKHLDAPRVPPSALRAELAACPGLDALVVRAIAAAPASRFRSMEELGDAILACLRAIDPAAAEHAAEITGELAERRDPGVAPAARWPWPGGWRALAVGIVATAVAIGVTSWGRGNRDGGLAGEVTPARAPSPDPEPSPSPDPEPATEPPPAAAAPPVEVDADAPPIDAPEPPDVLVVLDADDDELDAAPEPAPPPRRTARPRKPPPAATGAAALGVAEW